MLCVSSTQASDWTITSRLSQTFEINDNYFLVRDPPGKTYRSLSTIYLDSIYRAATSTHFLSGDLSYYKYAGPGAEDTQLKQGINNGASYRFVNFGKLQQDRDVFGFTWRRQDVAQAQLEDTGTITSSGESNIYIVDGAWTRQLDLRNTLTLLGRATANSFENEEQNFTDLFGSARITHAFNALTELVGNVDFDLLTYNDPQNTRTEFWKFMGGIVVRPTGQLLIRANFGYALANTSADPLPTFVTGGGGLPPPPPPQPGDPPLLNDPNTPPPLQPVQTPGSSITWIGDFYLTYRAKTETYTLFASKYVSPDTLGALQQRTTVGASMRHDINRRSGLSLASSYSITKSGQEPNVTQPANFNVVLGYDYGFTRELKGQLVYNYRMNFPDNPTPLGTTTTTLPPDNSPISSHGIFGVLTANVTLKP